VTTDIAIGETNGGVADSKVGAPVDSVVAGSVMEDGFVDIVVDIVVVDSEVDIVVDIVVDSDVAGSVADDSDGDESVVNSVEGDSALVDSDVVRIWQRGPEKPSRQRQPSSPVLESRKQVAPFWQGL